MKNPNNGDGAPVESGKKIDAKPRPKSTITRKGKSVSKPATAEELGRLRSLEPNDDEIRMRAYFIAERRHRLALPGDADSDWLEAKRQLLAELDPR